MRWLDIRDSRLEETFVFHIPVRIAPVEVRVCGWNDRHLCELLLALPARITYPPRYEVQNSCLGCISFGTIELEHQRIGIICVNQVNFFVVDELDWA
jgi:hypothetical protein